MEKEILYTAGIFDGEGWIGLDGKYLALRIVSTDKPLIDFLRKTWGGYIYKRLPKPNRKTASDWIIRHQSLERLLDAIYPHLIVKKGQVDGARQLLLKKKL